MPMYAYRCENGHEVEELRKFLERQDPGPACPTCGQPTSYVVSATKRQNFRFKNDSRNKGHNLKEI